ncbi:hypothetical protein scyTo_0014031 [Scyliorhinus torazame]|uniref:Secreted phosphoprotein 24 n=1 Tax=Scyliorhinus torazame TaxID=75743 RepID=A0A401NFU2_SCYTO|nr:hypothetical protein [Scyliorhinus torazame]
MKVILFIFAAAQILHCSGIPCASSTFSELKTAIDITIAKVNEEFATSNIFAIVKCELTNNPVFTEGQTTVNLTIDIQATVCNKSSGLDPANCSLIPIQNARTATCFSWVTLRRIENSTMNHHRKAINHHRKAVNHQKNAVERNITEEEDVGVAGGNMVQEEDGVGGGIGGVGGDVAGAEDDITDIDGITTGTTRTTTEEYIAINLQDEAICKAEKV